MSVEALADDPRAMKMASRIYANNCAVCHGADAGGALGFPNLTDNDWLYGGSPEKMKNASERTSSGNARLVCYSW